MTWFRRGFGVLGFFICLLALVGGCGKKPKVIPVYKAKGKIQVEGKPVQGLLVTLFTIDPDLEKDMAENQIPNPHAVTKDDGSFTLTTYKDEDGAPAGEYIVKVESIGQRRAFGQGSSPSPIAKSYSSRATTKLRAKIDAKPDNELETMNLSAPDAEKK
jgi:hypothetical protein